ncbi:MAG: hypothetical protein MUF87_15645 [Anaerolineae bacterium]|jgi:hypothetical protein|nr:hypothetical protein [Anaerolineae bacterium]
MSVNCSWWDTATLYMSVEGAWTVEEWLQGARTIGEWVADHSTVTVIIHYNSPLSYLPPHLFEAIPAAARTPLAKSPAIRQIIVVNQSPALQTISQTFTRHYGVNHVIYVNIIEEARHYLDHHAASA